MTPGEPQAHRFRRFFPSLILFIVILAGFFVRIDSLQHWLDNKPRHFFDKQTTPLMLTVDAYYYLDIAGQLGSGDFAAFDQRRRAPEGLQRNPTPPMLSVLLAGLAGFTGFSLEWIAAVLPVLWGALLGLPVYLLVERLLHDSPEGQSQNWISASQAAALVAAAVALLSPRLVVRTSLGWFDTDGLNVLFSVFAVYFAAQVLLNESGRTRTLWFTLGGINLFLFIWTWDQSLVAALGLGGAPMATALVLAVLADWRRTLPFILAALALSAVLVVWKGLHLIDPHFYLKTLSGYLSYFGNHVDASSPFPPAGSYVSEQQGHTFAEIAALAAGHTWVFIGGIAGLCLAAILRWRLMLLLAAMTGVAMLSFSAQRFEIFIAPLLGLGIGVLVFLLWQLVRPLPFKIAGVAAVALLSTWSAAVRTTELNSLAPRRNPVLFDGMLKVREKTPTDSVIWASWNHGHPMVFYTDRATIADGMWHPSSMLYVINYPLAGAEFRGAANWMQFYATRGMTGLLEANAAFGDSSEDWAAGGPKLQTLLSAGLEGARGRLTHMAPKAREALLEFLFPADSRPIILFLDYLHPYTGWYEAGTWNFTTRSHAEEALFVPLGEVELISGKRVVARTRSGPLEADLDTGQVRFNYTRLALGQIRIYDGKNTYDAPLDDLETNAMALHLPARSGVMGERSRLDSVFSKLFFELRADMNYFRPVHLQPPYYGIWEVHGERYRPAESDQRRPLINQ